MVGGLKKRVEAVGALPDLSPFAEKLLGREKLPVSKRIVDDSKVTDHHAIIPTNKKSSGGLPPEAKVYIWWPARSAVLPEALRETT